MSVDLAAVRAWRDLDPDPVTRAEVDDLVAAGDSDAIRDRFAADLSFGTAGLRGPLGAGPNRMNRLTVRRATAGLVAHLDASGAIGPVVVGRDARHGSAAFLAEVVAVVGGAGRRAVVLPQPCPTPLVAFAVRHLRAAAGVMITASHNPPGDNGYKVYLDDGMQIVTPVDAAIASAIAATDVGSIALEPRHDDADPSLVEAYLDGAVGASLLDGAGAVSIAYTPLHGVGGALALEVFERAGFVDVATVAEQFDPDPTFPTVVFPNPEEPGAMDRVIELARERGCDLAIAHDPDADRLGVAVAGHDGAWRRLAGDEVGALLADHILRHARLGRDAVLATTVVSSRLLFSLAEEAGVTAVETLTGFKWIARAADERRFVFGYEEALGYQIGTHVRDKDGLSAAIVFAELTADLASRGRSVADRLDELARRHGVHVTSQQSVRAEGTGAVVALRAAFERLRDQPPSHLAGRTVDRVVDLADGETLPPADGLILTSEDARVVIRPSGTEPKLKRYVEVVTPVVGDDLPGARRAASLAMTEIHTALDGLVQP